MLTAGGIHHRNGLTVDGRHLSRAALTANGEVAMPMWPTRPAPHRIDRTTLAWDQVRSEGVPTQARARTLAPLRRFALAYRAITRRSVDTVFVRFFLDVSKRSRRFLVLDPSTGGFFLCRVDGGLEIRQSMVMDYEMMVTLAEVL